MQKLRDLFSLEGQSAIVTGAAMGIGERIAHRFAEAGAAIVIADRDADRSEAVARELQRLGAKARALCVDVANVSDATRCVETAVEDFGRVDILVNNAGIFPSSPALDLTEGDWDRVLSVNLKGAFFLSQAAAKRMRGQGSSIVNIASIDALHPAGTLAHYDASKGGLVMLTRSLALEFAPLGIRVNAVCPGAIQTPGADEAMTQMARGTSAAAVREAFAARIPLKRMGTPDEIALATLFLASRASSYVTGSTLVVDGGYLLS